jgi:hypothetical protein
MNGGVGANFFTKSTPKKTVLTKAMKLRAFSDNSRYPNNTHTTLRLATPTDIFPNTLSLSKGHHCSGRTV